MAETNIVPDGTFNFAGGQNAALDPDMIAANQYFIGENVSAEEGNLKPRWAIQQLTFDFTPAGDYTRTSGVKVSFEEIFKSGKQQAFIPYSIGPTYYWLYIVSGFIYIFDLYDFTVDVLNKTDQLNVYADRINWSNAGSFLVIFDWPNRPFILDGIQIKRSDPTKDEVPVSVLGTYNQNRLCIGNPGIDWTAGDPSGSPATPDAPVTFIEILQPSTGYTGDVYQVPTANKNNDVITAMGFLQVLDKSTGIGSLIVATNNATYAYPTYLPRAEWQGGSTGAVFGSMLVPVGMAGQRAHVNVNSDVIFVSPEGQVYAFTVARNDQYKWSNTPISREVSNFLTYIDDTVVKVTAAAEFKNKIFITCDPHRVDCTSAEGVPQIDYVNSGVVVLETSNMAFLSNQSSPAWAGRWTGVQFVDFGKNNKKFYCAGKVNNRNELFLIDHTSTLDYIDGKEKPITSTVITKEYSNGDPTINKGIHSVDIGLQQMKGRVELNLEYKPSTTDNYYFWKNIVFNAPYRQCEALPLYPNGLSTQGIRDLTIAGINEHECIPNDGALSYVYKGLQVRVTLTGEDWRLKYVKLKGKVMPQTPNDPYCEEQQGVPIPKVCVNDIEVC